MLFRSEHHGRFIESKRGDECCLPLIFFPNSNVVIAPTNIKLSEQSGVFHVVDQLRDEGKRISIANSVGVEILIVLARSQSAVLLRYEEE